jgi:hypothetical protein
MMNKFLRRTILSFIPMVAIAQSSDPVKAAYQAIPHAQKTYRASASNADSQALEKFFATTDQLLVERMEFYLWLLGRTQAEPKNDYPLLLKQLSEMKVPNALKPTQLKIVKAADLQREYLEEWLRYKKQGKPYPLALDAGASAPKVNESHQLLFQAYGELMSAFPKETEENKKAFFEHLCALDFL